MFSFGRQVSDKKRYHFTVDMFLLLILKTFAAPLENLETRSQTLEPVLQLLFNPPSPSPITRNRKNIHPFFGFLLYPHLALATI